MKGVTTIYHANGHREVRITEKDGRYTAYLYVGIGGEKMMPTRWTGKTLAGAKRFARKVLAAITPSPVRLPRPLPETTDEDF